MSSSSDSNNNNKNKKQQQNQNQGQNVIIILIVGSLIALLSIFTLNPVLFSYSASPDVTTTTTTATTKVKVNQQQEQQDKLERYIKYNTTYRYTPPTLEDPYPTPMEHCGTSPDYKEFFQRDYKERSRMNEDMVVYNTLFKNKLVQHSQQHRETIVELGAYDGSQESNSKFFERCLGWKTLLIEGNPESYEKVVNNRPNTYRMSFAPSCSKEYEQENKTIQFYKYPLTNVGLVGSAVTFTGRPTVDVPCGPLGPVLEDVFEPEEKRITFFSLDVEGSEPLVLDTIDFDKVLIEVLMIEIQNNNCQAKCVTRDQVRTKMSNLGYYRYQRIVHASDIYIHPKSRYQMPNTTQRSG